jgi:DNA-binding MarR family transcriptional regulator
LEKSSVSRMLRKLVDAGAVAERPNPDDARAKLLVLTMEGQSTLAAIDAFAKSQVGGAFAHLSSKDRDLVAAGLAAYARALRMARLGG